MAALAQPDIQETVIRQALSSVPVPENMRLQRLEFRNDSTGDPALFLVFSRKESQKSDEDQVEDLLTLKDAARRKLRDLELPLFPYFVFVPAE